MYIYILIVGKHILYMLVICLASPKNYIGIRHSKPLFLGGRQARASADTHPSRAQGTIKQRRVVRHYRDGGQPSCPNTYRGY